MIQDLRSPEEKAKWDRHMTDWKPIETARPGQRVEGLRVDGKGTVIGKTPRASSVAPIGRNVVNAGGMRWVCSHWREPGSD